MVNINKLWDRLNILSKDNNINNFLIPGLWDNIKDQSINIGNPFTYLLRKIEEIINYKPTNSKIEIQDEIIYNMMPRLTTANYFNKNVQNQILNDNGSILKTIALLPYIKSLGTTILYLLPITSIGENNKKGNLGSVFAIKNPYKIDENLNEKILDLDIEIQFSALVEAAHHLGIKVICEFIFRTASIDSDIALKHPEWFYWIKLSKINTYSQPIFNTDDLIKIKKNIEDKKFDNSIPPNSEYISMFTDTPKNVFKENGQIIGELANGEKVTIPNAFADWPPDDQQPVWSDVTYYKFFNNPKFNYISYNTVRMYDNELLDNIKYYQNELFEFITDIVPYYINKYNIDGIMLDMGHALPKFLRSSIIEKARNLKKDFIFLEENFNPNNDSLAEGFNAVVGYLIFDMDKPNKMNDYIKRLENEEIVIPVFATPENHNTPRIQFHFNNADFSIMLYGLASFLPNSIRFIHSGFETLETIPVNTGLNFTKDELKQYSPSDLPLFSTAALKWEKSIVDKISEINLLRDKVISGSINNYKVVSVNNNNSDIVSYKLVNEKEQLLIIANYNKDKQNVKIKLKNNYKKFILLTTKRIFEVCNNDIELELNGYDFFIGILI